MIVSGDVSEHLYVYLQPDFASSVPGSPDANQFCQIRDWYGDVYLDDDKVWRIRVGQSKIPYGWENLQSSSNRLPLDRNDALNSAVRNERDLGVFFYWTPEPAQDLFKYVLDEGLKGSGNYGVFGFGCYNGQGGSFNEQNDNLHIVARLAVPYQFESGQVMEWGLQGYTGQYAVLSSPILPLGVGPATRPLGTLEQGTNEVLDQRAAATFVWYPQPWGFQTEWNVGRGPALNDDQTEVDLPLAQRRLRDDDVSPRDRLLGRLLPVPPVSVLPRWLQARTERTVRPHRRMGTRPGVAVQPADGTDRAVHLHRPDEHGAR